MSDIIISEIKPFNITRNESNLDRACDEAYRNASWYWKIDEDGHVPKSSILPEAGGFERSTDTIVVTFINYQRFGNSHVYGFTTRIERCEDE